MIVRLLAIIFYVYVCGLNNILQKHIIMKISNNLVNKMKNNMSNQGLSGKNGNRIAGEFIDTLMAAGPQTHRFHLMTDSYADHMALNGFYNEIPGLTDSLAELYQGTHGFITGYSNQLPMMTKYDPVGYLTSLRKYVENTRQKVSNKSNFINITDAVLDLIDSTVYKLTKLTK